MNLKSTFNSLATALLVLSIPAVSLAQLDLAAPNTVYTVDFDGTVPGVNEGVFDASGFEPTPAAGQVDSDAWSVNGLSQGNLDFGQSGTTSDYAQGISVGGEFSGGVYAWETSPGDYAIGLQPTGSDWTPGDLIFKVQNNTGAIMDSLVIDYDIKINNDADRGNTFNFAHSSDNITYTDEPSMDYLSTELSQGSVMWVTEHRSITLTGLGIANGDFYYLRWDGQDSLGGGGRDEFAIDNLELSVGVPIAPPAGDTIKPFIVDGIFLSNTQVKIAWSEGITQATAEDANNYTGTPTDVTSVTQTHEDTVIATFASPLTGGTLYQVVFSGVTDTSTNANVMDNDTIEFYFTDYSGDDLVINEIFYNEPANVTTDLEYIELYNKGANSIDLGGMEFASGVELFFDNYTMTAGEYVVLVSNEVDFMAAFPGVTATIIEWDNGSLADGGEYIAIENTLGGIVDEVDYDDGGSWPAAADGDGYTLTLCDATTDNNVGTNWYITNSVAATVNGDDIFGSPGAANMCAVIPAYPIAEVTGLNANGNGDSLGVTCILTGLVYGIDYRGGNGYSFTIIDETDGINVFSFGDVDGYVVTEGDEIEVTGTIDEFNGLLEIIPSQISILSTDNCIPLPRIVTDLDESTESDFIRINNVEIVGGLWPNGGFSENLDIVISGTTDTLVMRIDSDTDVEAMLPTQPVGTFDLIGIGGQFDGSDPRTEGYQIFPRSAADFITVSNPAPTPDLVINEVMPDNDTTFADGAGDFDDWIEIYNNTSSAIDLAGMYLTNDPNDWTKWRFPSCDASTEIPANGWLVVWADNEEDEGSLHANFDLDANGGWVGLYAVDGVGEINTLSYEMLGTDQSYGPFPDGDTNLVIQTAPTPGAANFFTVGVREQAAGANGLLAYPNPVRGGTVFFNKATTAEVFNLLGQPVDRVRNAQQLDVSEYPNGIYIVRSDNGEIVRVIKH